MRLLPFGPFFRGRLSWRVQLALMIIGALLLPASGQAADPSIAPGVVVAAGASIVLVEPTEKPITAEAAGSGLVGVVRKEKLNALVYTAATLASTVDDKVTYSLDGKPWTVSITVRDQAPTLTSPDLYKSSFKAVFSLFILAVVVESGLALMFRWSPFLNLFDGRRLDPLVSFAFSLLLVWSFHLDVTTALMNTYSNTTYPWGWEGLILTAMIIAGGSAGVNRMLQTLGFRPAGGPPIPPPLPPQNEAWIAVKLIRAKAVGPVTVQIGSDANLAVAGTIGYGSVHDGEWWRYFFRDRGRFPQSGGHVVVPGPCRIQLDGVDANGKELPPAVWGVHIVADRAVIDVELKL